MVNIKRYLNLADLLAKKSHFLLGPRQTGKTHLIRHDLKDAKVYNLLDSDVFFSLARQPSRLRQELKGFHGPVVIDEIQKLPELLDAVQILIEEQNLKFLLTGSSARKLRSGGVNLLGGRARSRRLHPFIYEELGSDFNLLRALNHGLLPSIYFSEAPAEDLKAYVGDYLKEEILAESLTRNIPAFGRFLEVAALANGQVINYQKIASDAEVARTTVQDYFSILKDTLIAEEIEPWRHSKSRKAIAKSKFYFFDVGLVNSLQNLGEIKPRSKNFGDAFESFIFQELAAYRSYVTQGSLHYWRTTAGDEVDFILDNKIAIEIKAKERVAKDDLTSLRLLQAENQMRHYLLVCNEPRAREVDGVRILPWQDFLKMLWSGAYS